MRRKAVRIVALCGIVAVGAMVAFLATLGVQQGATPVDSPLIGTRAPTATESTLAGGTVSMASLRGSVVVLAFFASWCPPCRAEAPELATFAYRAHAQHRAVALYGVVFNDSDLAAGAFVRTYGGSYPVLRDPQGALAADFGVTSPPVTVVVGPTGRVAAVLYGAVTAAQLDQVSAAAAGGAA